MEQHHQLKLSHRRSSSSSSSSTKMILTPSYLRSNSYNNSNSSSDLSPYAHQMICIGNYCCRSSSWSHDPSPRNNNSHDSSSTAITIPHGAKGGGFFSLIRSLLCAISIPSLIIPAAYRWLTANIISSASCALSAVTPPLSHKITTGTLFGHRKGHVFFTIQDHPRSKPLLILDLPMSTSALVKEMSSGLVRIALECDKAAASLPKPGKKRNKKLMGEVEWTMYCNSRKCGTARSMESSDFAMFVLSTVESISVGAGVIPMVSDGKNYDYGELMYMRAGFERVVGNRDSEALYMMNPDGNVGLPELSIFLLRL